MKVKPAAALTLLVLGLGCATPAEREARRHLAEQRDAAEALERQALSEVREALAQGRPLAAQQHLEALDAPLRQAGKATVATELKGQVQAVGARRCLVLSANAKSPWLASWVGAYCHRFGAQGPRVGTMPERRSRLALDVNSLKCGSRAREGLQQAATRVFAESIWSDASADGAVEARLDGAVESRRSEAPIVVNADWTEMQAYSVQEQQTETYQESHIEEETYSEPYTEYYTTTESRPVTVTYTESESYTYSCGYGTSYQTCYGTRPVTRTRTEYRSESVTRSRTAYRQAQRPVTKFTPKQRQVTRTVTKYRPVVHPFRFPAIEKSVTHGAALQLVVALPGTPAPVKWTWSDQLRQSDAEHSVVDPAAGVSPHRAELKSDEQWEETAAAALAQGWSQHLDAAWVSAFCGTTMSAEEAARCVASSAAPSSAWSAVNAWLGEPVERLARR
jgi:hypothetical protein